LKSNNIEKIKDRVTKYANFVSRVVYDMKWYEPPIQTIRNQVFRTNINKVIKFLVDHLFLRLSQSTNIYSFQLELDENIPNVHINEYVIWEILEPLIQNSIDHSSNDKVIINIGTKFIVNSKLTVITISDDGEGISEELLEINQNGIKNIFAENTTSKSVDRGKRGYGCYIAYQMATVRCGWKIDAENLETGGCKFSIEIQN
jgi:signal transduction histidine kinase